MGREQSHNIDAVLADISEHWSPRTIAVVNDYDVRVVKVKGEFTRHSHTETDEFFLVLSGQLTIRMERSEVVLNRGDTYVVPRGVVHQPCAEVETTLLLFRTERDCKYRRFAGRDDGPQDCGLNRSPRQPSPTGVHPGMPVPWRPLSRGQRSPPRGPRCPVRWRPLSRGQRSPPGDLAAWRGARRRRDLCAEMCP